MSHERIFAKVARAEFVGRDAELRRLADYASEAPERKLFLFAAPNVGASEFLRQAYDELFLRRTHAVPIYFAFGKERSDLTSIAVSFFQSFLQQYVAYRRVDPSLCRAPLTFHDLIDLALPTDYEPLTSLVESFERERVAADELTFLRFCLAAPQKLAGASKRKILPLIDCLALSGESSDSKLLRSVAAAFVGRREAAIIAGLRRQIPGLIHAGEADLDAADTMHIQSLNDHDAGTLLDTLTRSLQIEANQQTRDLIVQQLGGSPFFLAALAQSSRGKRISLTSFFNCQLLYVDELMGGRMHRHFSTLLSQIAPQTQTRRKLLQILSESRLSETRKASVWTWKKRLGVDGAELERMIDTLHVHELANSSGATIEVNPEPVVWLDYLAAQYRMEVSGEARALTVANTRLNSLKRAPQAMRQKYRRATALGLQSVLSHFNCQEIPASLFDYKSFAAAHAGDTSEAINEALDADENTIQLPQIVSAVDCSTLATTVETEVGRCVLGHGFEAGEYTDKNEIAWIAAEIDSKLEVGEDVTKEWCARLGQIAREAKIGQVKLWLVSPEGFTAEASRVLKQHHAYGSSHRQVELLTARLQSDQTTPPAAGEEYSMVIPMGLDTELIAAQTVEQIARRMKFGPEAINQIKLALVEACINATEHSLSPDRKTYLGFRLEADKLTITVASRGVVPANLFGQKSEATGNDKSRRGFGLKVISKLMNEVEFERVDDGTQLRMTKYLHSSAS